jgi:hypothetical protein
VKIYYSPAPLYGRRRGHAPSSPADRRDGERRPARRRGLSAKVVGPVGRGPPGGGGANKLLVGRRANTCACALVAQLRRSARAAASRPREWKASAAGRDFIGSPALQTDVSRPARLAGQFSLISWAGRDDGGAPKRMRSRECEPLKQNDKQAGEAGRPCGPPCCLVTSCLALDPSRPAEMRRARRVRRPPPSFQ